MNRGVEEVFFSKVSGKIILEIFEKSIDKHKIDAILECAVLRKRSFFYGLFDSGRDVSRRIPRKNPVSTIPIQSAKNSPGAFMSLWHGRERCKGIVRCIWGCSLKSVE